MKFIIKIIIALSIINYQFLINANAQVAINSDGTDPDASAILDIKSTTSGLLVPRLTTTQRDNMPSKVEGLLVYDTDLQSYMLYDGTVWFSFRSYLSDADNDNLIDVEKATDEDKVRLNRSTTDMFSIERNGNGDARLQVNDDILLIGKNTVGLNLKGSSSKVVAIGTDAVANNTEIDLNVSIGHGAGKKPNGSYVCNIIGFEAVGSPTATERSVYTNVVGYRAGYQMANTDFSQILGYEAGYYTDARYSVLIGYQAGYNAFVAGSSYIRYNVMLGYQAGYNTTSQYNTFIGRQAGYFNTDGQYNNLIGSTSGRNLTTGIYNTAIGHQSGYNLSDGTDNVLIGRGAGYNYSGDSSVFIGRQAGYNETNSRRLYIDNSNTASPLIYGEFDNDLVRVNGTLNIKGQYSFPITDGTNGQTILFDNSGNGYWADGLILNQTLAFSNNTLTLSNGGGSADISKLKDQVTLTNGILSAGDGSTVDLNNQYDQTLSVSGTTLTISNGNSVTLPSTGSDNLGNHTLSQALKASGKWISNDGDSEGLYLPEDGKVNVGSSSTQDAVLYVGSHVSNNFNSYGNYGRISSNGCGTSNTDSRSVSIWATGGITADKFFATSDERIKNIQGLSNNEQDLATLMQLEIVNYTYKDTIAKGNISQKKVIAQQVAQVFPQAVNTNNIEVIPNIMQMATIENGWVVSSELPVVSCQLKEGDKVKLIFENHEELVEILEVKNDGFRIQQATGNGQQETVFIYGTQVNDFHIVDYDALGMLNVSATQALTKRNETLKQRQTSLNTDLDDLATQTAKIDALEAMILEMKAAKEQ